MEMSTEASEMIRGRAYQLCKDYLLGAWKHIGEENMILKQIRWENDNHRFLDNAHFHHRYVD